MNLLLDIGNTHTHAGLANDDHILRHADFHTNGWRSEQTPDELAGWLGKTKVDGAIFCSVVPQSNSKVRRFVRGQFGFAPLQLTPQTITGIGIDYPRPETIGQDRLANAVAAAHQYGAPCVVVDFGTAVSFDIVDHAGNYVGGIIAPGLAALTEYLHEKTALLPRVRARETKKWIGKSTREAMLIGAIHGYRGMTSALLKGIKKELKSPGLPVIATGGCAKLITSKMPEINSVEPLLTLEGLRLVLQSGVQD